MFIIAGITQDRVINSSPLKLDKIGVVLLRRVDMSRSKGIYVVFVS